MSDSHSEVAERQYPAGAELFADGDDSQELYVLLEGSVAVEKGGREVAMIAEAGAYFGEMSSLLGCRRTATVRTREPSTLLVVPPEKIGELFGSTPQLALRMARVLARRLAETTQELAGNCEWLNERAGEG